MENLKIILADDHKVFRLGLESVLKGKFINSVFYHANNGLDVFAILEQQTINLILLDIEMPVQDGYSTIEQLKKIKNRPKVIVMSFHDDTATVLRCMKMGADGYLQKNAGITTICKSINTVLNNELYFTLPLSINPHPDNSVIHSVRKPELKEMLNHIELKIVYYIFQQLTTKGIANKMNLSKRTIDAYRSNILNKTNSKNILGLLWLLPPPKKTRE